METRTSVYLDIIRVVAAYAVLFQHLSMAHENLFPALQNFGHFAVIAFFVLSGYVIAFVTTARETNFQTYLSHRFARIFSVMTGAWCITVIADIAGFSMAPDVYSGLLANDMAVIRLFAHITFLHEAWFVSVQWYSNQPLWSLSYEFWYYLLFGVFVFLRGWLRAGLLVAGSLLVGPPIMIYGLIWYAGVVLYRLHNHSRRRPVSTTLARVMFVLSLVMACSIPYWKHYIDIPVTIHRKLDPSVLATDFLFAIAVCTNILFFHYSNISFCRIAAPVRFLAGFSFSLYVFHFPLILLYQALFEQWSIVSGTVQFLMILLLVPVTVYGLSFITEKRKRFYLRFFTTLFAWLHGKVPTFGKSNQVTR